MSLKFCLMTAISAGVLITATPSFASLSWPTNDRAAQRASERCDQAAAAAQVNNDATDADLAKCTKAAQLADFSSDRAIALSNRSLLNFERANYDAAIEDNNAALKINDKIAEVLVNRGAIYLGMHHADEAAASFTRALALAPAQASYTSADRARMHFDLAMAREDMNDLHGAYAEYAEASRLDPQWDAPRQQMGRFSVVTRKPIG